ncbi:MAG: DEAD/DEAH box helicase family protein [Chlorobiaceae bacterium]|nr:DEAD/DEAH box helicase family protein [Chlorobiaceae bacterium]
MILRPYQNRAVQRGKAALKKKGNTMIVASTGAGKTIMLASLAGEVDGKTLILQHRQELVQQNASKFLKVNPEWRISQFTADEKSFGGKAVFAMQQTLTRNLEYIPAFDHVIVDETHHIVAPTYQAIIDACKDRNPDLMLSGFTATPERGDRKSLRKYFDNVADKITIRELVGLGFLVPPRAFVVNVGAQQELAAIKNLSAFGDQTEVANILDTTAINGEVIRHWREKASGRKTIVFCATIQHAIDVCDAFKAAGISSGVITGDMSDGDRKSMLFRFDKGDLQVIVNVAVLTEGYDSQPVSCVILLRQCSEKSPMIQMAGRGLRTVDPELYPGVIKRDCIILDFGTSLLTHGNLDQEDGLHEEAGTDAKGKPVTKICPEFYAPGMVYKFPDRSGSEGCGAEVPAQTKRCPFCGFEFERLDGKVSEVTEVSLTELDILNASPFRWLDLFGTDTCLMATGFSAWAGVFSPDKGETFYAMGKKQDDKRVYCLAVTGRLQAMSAADDFLRQYETDKAARKSKRWLDDPATEKQVEILNRFGYQAEVDMMGNSGFTKYGAACHASFHFNRAAIERALGVAG